MIKVLMKQVRVRDELLEQQENCLFKKERVMKNSKNS
jgi:hypothetical protein